MQLSNLCWRRASIGLIVTLVCSIAGQALAKLPGFSLIGHLVLALVLGMCLQFARSLTAAAQQSTPFIANKFLRAGIILLGFKLNLVILMSAGLKSLEAAVIIVAVMIDEPTRGSHYGGTVAGPVFNEVAAGALRLIGVHPDDPHAVSGTGIFVKGIRND